MDKFLQMQAFATVVDAGSFVKAAQTLGMSKQAVSRCITELESRLGARLLQRTTRKLSLTEEGQLFYVRCTDVLSAVDDAEAEIAAGNDEASGPLRINVPLSFGLLHLAPLWPRFMKLYPKVLLDVTLVDRVVDLVDEGFDLAVRIATLPNSSLVTRKLGSTRVVLCASPHYLDEHGRPAHPFELARHRVMSYSLLSTGETWEFTGPDGPVSVKVTPRLRTNSGDTCRAAALQHEGIILQPAFMVGEDLASGALVEVLPDYRSIELGIHVVYPSRKFLAPKVRLLIDFLVEAFRTQAWPG